MLSIYIRAVKGTGLVDRLIRARTGSPYSHVEFAYPLVGSRVYRPSWLGSQPHGGVQVRPYDYLGTVQYDLFAVAVSLSTLSRVRSAAGSMIRTCPERGTAPGAIRRFFLIAETARVTESTGRESRFSAAGIDRG